MAVPASSAIDIKSLEKGGDANSPFEAKILAILENAVNNLSPTELSAEATAGEIDNLYPSDVSAAEDFLWSFWTLLAAVAKKIPADDARQQLLVSVIQKLKARRDEEVEMWGQKTRVWSELPMFGPVMRDEWNCEFAIRKEEPTLRNWVTGGGLQIRLMLEFENTNHVH